MLLNNKFYYFARYKAFESLKGDIPKESITFIQDRKCVYAYGQFFYCNGSQLDETLQNYVTKEDFEQLQNKVTSPLNYKGSVDTYDQLPNDAKIGDVYNVISSDMNYAWTGDSWDQFGSSQVAVVNDLTSGGATVALSAEQGKVLNQKITDLDEAKQDKGNYVPYIDKEGRKVVQFNNNDIIGSLANTESIDNQIPVSGWVSLLQLNRWNVVDVGSPKTLTNINTPKNVRPTVQEAGQSGQEAHQIAYLSDVEAISGNVTNINNLLTWYIDETV